MIIVFTGNGKGKTTAALGQALRSIGEQKKVFMIQFIKGPWKSGEDESFKKLMPDLMLIKTGLGFVGILGDTVPREDHIKAAEYGYTLALKEIEFGLWDMYILDEINVAVSLGLIAKEKILELLREFRKVEYTTGTHGEKAERYLILTGRDAPSEFVDEADLVTEMRDIKHPYEKGIKAKRGLEY